MKSILKQRKENYSFFARMLLICTSLLLLFCIISSILVGVTSYKYDKIQYLKSYDLCMVSLSEVFSGHMEAFSVLVGKVMDNNECDESLCTLLEASSYDEVPAGTRSHVMATLSSFCSNDQALQGVLLYSPQNNMLYYYSNARSYLSYGAGTIEDPGLKPYAGTKLDNETLEKAILTCTREEALYDSYYGFAATLYRNSSQPLGYLIPLFATSELGGILQNYNLDPGNRFRISDDLQHTFFQSSPAADAGDPVYTNSVTNLRHGFQVSYEVSRNNLPKSRTTVLIVLFSLVVTLFSFLLYYATYYLCNKNIHGILDGMQRFSLKNLSYRIPRPRGRNEFTQIIDGFNVMCEELQKNVERSYVYELQQKKSELYALQTSINPHFLYNTLEMIRSQVLYSNTSRASQMLTLLARIYRTQTDTGMFITIEEEVELCENFIILYQNRFQNFDYDFDIEDETRWAALPKNTLQPMIENYFVHGIKADKQDNLLELSVTSYEENGGKYIHLSLGNNGNAITPERIAELTDKLQSGIFENHKAGSFALTNVYSRLKIAFGDNFRLVINTGDEDIHFRIDLTFPAVNVHTLQDTFTLTTEKERLCTRPLS